jgi:amino acid adenylation domain-containing protein/FkbM family methyltransferase
MRTLLALVQDAAERYGSNVAVRDTTGEITYDQLQTQYQKLAGRLGDLRGQRVGVCLTRSTDVIVAQLATWTSGAICVPLDPAYPPERLRTMTATAGVEFVIIHGKTADRISAEGVSCHRLDAAANLNPDAQVNTSPPLATPVGEADGAFIFFTSGTTGRPKAVLVPHVGLWNRIFWGIGFHELDSTDRVLWKAPHGFDAAVGEIYSALGAGATVVVAPPDSEKDPAELCAVVQQQEVTVLHSTPPMLRALADEPAFGDCTSLRHLWSGGQILNGADVGRVLARTSARLTNQYGPTEASINATAGRCAPDTEVTRPTSIGTAIDGMRAYVLDDELDLVPDGQTGELYLGGVGLANGYVGDTRSTAGAFVPDHLSGTPGARLYRTGDLAVSDRDGFTIVGRADDQVKVRGYRVEPGEVAAILATHPDVAQATVTGWTNTGGDTGLAAFLTARAGRGTSANGYARITCTDALAPASLNEHETRFLFDDIFVKNAYLRHGVTIGDGDIVVDVGGNVGMFMLFAHSQARLERHVAFEPNPLAADVFRTNVELHGTSAELHEVAVGATDGFADLTSYDEFSYLSGLHADGCREKALVSSFLRQAAERDSRVAESLDELHELTATRLKAHSHRVLMRRLSGLLAEHRVDRIDLLKINVERSEVAVLQGVDPEDWRMVRQVVLELEDADGALGEARALLEHAGFSVSVDRDWSVGREQAVYYLYATRPGSACRAATPQRLGERPLTADDVRIFLQDRLPDFMIPAEIRLVDTLPTMPNGKTDIESLLGSLTETKPEAETPEPSSLTDTERTVAGIWTEVLGRDGVRPSDDIFDLGAHSVTVAQVVARIRARFGIRLPLRTVFETRTLAAIAAAIDLAVSGESGEPAPAAPARPAEPQPVAPDNAPAPFLATAGQRSLWWLSRIEPARADYNDHHVLELTGRLDVPRMARAVRVACARQVVLGCALHYHDGQLYNRPVADTGVNVLELDQTGADDAAVDAAVHRVINERFDVSSPGLIRAAVITRAADRHVLAMVAHHSVCDEWSWHVLWEDICTHYAGRELPGPDDAYRGFAALEERRLADELTDGLEFWTQRLHAVAHVEWRCPASPVPRSNGTGRRRPFVVSRPELDALRSVASSCGGTGFMSFFAAYSWLLAAVTTAADPVIGVPVSLRDRVEFEGSFGYYVNMNAVPSDCTGDPTFAMQVQRTRDVILEADPYRWVPFDRVVKAVNPAREATGNPLFRSAIVLHDNKDLSRPLGDDLEATERRWHNGTAKFDLTLEVGLREDRAECSFEYADHVFDDPGAQRLATIFASLLAWCGQEPGLHLSDALVRVASLTETTEVSA